MTINQQYPVSALAHKRSHGQGSFAPLLTQCREFEQLLREVQQVVSTKLLDKERWKALNLRIGEALTKKPVR